MFVQDFCYALEPWSAALGLETARQKLQQQHHQLQQPIDAELRVIESPKRRLHSIYIVGTRQRPHFHSLNAPSRLDTLVGASAAATASTASSTSTTSSSDSQRVEDVHPLQQHQLDSSGRPRRHCNSSSTSTSMQLLQRPPAASRLVQRDPRATGIVSDVI